MAIPSPVREGVLSTTTFPGLIYSILSRKETGVLTLTGDTIEKSIFIQSGRPVFATSNDRDDRLGQIFFKSGQVSLEGLIQTVERAAQENKRLGTVFVEMGLIQPHDLVEGVMGQVRNIVCSLFLWTSGSCTHYHGVAPPPSGFPLNIDGWDVLDEGLRRRIHAGREELRVGMLRQRRILPATGPQLLRMRAALPQRLKQLLSELDRPMRATELRRISSDDPDQPLRDALLLLYLGAVRFID